MVSDPREEPSTCSCGGSVEDDDEDSSLGSSSSQSRSTSKGVGSDVAETFWVKMLIAMAKQMKTRQK